jgi:hypothetical protein
MPFRLRHLQHNFELSQGEFLVGRSAECQLAVDDPLVSRKHAVLLVGDDSVTIKDLGSRNGVSVNGARIQGPVGLGDGDRIQIGAQEMTFVAWKAAANEAPTGTRRRAGMDTLSVIPNLERAACDAEREASKRIDSLTLLSTVADKAFALGRADDAERILGATLQLVLRDVGHGLPIAPETVELAGQYAVRLAGATTKGTWVDYVVALYSHQRRPCPGAIIDELHLVIRKVASIDLGALRTYVQVLHENSSGYSPTERFLVQRVEGLERLASLR